MRRLLVLFVVWLPTIASAQNDFEAGLFAPAQQLPLVSQSVAVRIDGGDARIELVQVFANDGPDIAQADYRLHLPNEAVVTGFGFWHDGRLLRAELKEREAARQAHAAAAGGGRPTAILHRDGTIHSFSVYPVPGGTLQEVEIALTMPVSTERGRSHVRLPLDRFLGHATLASTVVASIRTEEPLEALGVDGTSARIRQPTKHTGELVFSAVDPVDIWWTSDAPPLLAAAESIPLVGGSSAIQLRLALNDGGGRSTPDDIVLLVDGSYSMRRRARAIEELLRRVLDQATASVRVVAVADEIVDVSAPDPREMVRRLAGGVAGFAADWEALETAAAAAGCGLGGTRCIAVTDPQALVPFDDRGIEVLVLGDADELAHFEDRIDSTDRVFQPGVEADAVLFALADELVLPVLEVLSVTQDGRSLDLIGKPRLQVAQGGLLRLYAGSGLASELRVALAIDGRRVDRSVAVERLDPEDRLGRSLRRGYYRARIDEWTAEYRRGRDPELRQQIIDVSIREGLPSDLTALHVAAPDRVLARTATAGPLLRPIGMLLLAFGAVVLILSRRFGP